MATLEKKSGNAGKWVQKGEKFKISNQINVKGFNRKNRKREMKLGNFCFMTFLFYAIQTS
jgi:hypothetical protein